MGDVWLTSKMSDENGYEKRVDIQTLSDWKRDDSSSEKPRLRKKRSSMHACLAMSAMLGMGGFGMGGGGRSSYAERNDPDRPKTDEDLRRMDAAREKRERKAKRKS